MTNSEFCSLPFNCPTSVHADTSFSLVLKSLASEASWALVTSAFWSKHETVLELLESSHSPTTVLTSVTPNPTISEVVRSAQELPFVDFIVALGGGSVIDTAKGLAALSAINYNTNLFHDHLTAGALLPEDFSPMPVIAIPTTSGTGSEVTKWASIWGDDGAKFSLTHPALFPKNAILDPGLCTSMPRELTLYSALDTLSHAMESIWNVKHTSVSDAFATMAIRMVKGRLIEVLENPGDKKLRSQLQTAALFGGMAMSMTQTAIAHAISYPLTSHLGLPHGFACGFTLPEVARFIGERHPQRISLIAEAFGCRNDDLTKNMVLWFRSLGVADSIQRFALPEDIENLDCSFINPSRSNNTLRAVDNEIARRIAVRALEQLLEED